MRKRLLSLVSLVLVCLMLAACGSSTTTPSTAPESTAPESTAPESTAPTATTDWPTKPLTVIVAAGAGGDTDLNTRIFCKYLEKELGQTVVVSNIKGISVALPEIKDAAADGYTFGIYHPGMFVSSALGTIDFDYTAFDILNIVAEDAQSGWFVAKDAPYQTLDELVAAAKEQPISFATEVGSVSHLTMFNFMQLAPDTQFNIVDAGGSADKITALLGGQLNVMYNQVGLVKDYLANGDFTCLGIMAAERSEVNPDIPTFKEQGYDMDFSKPYFAFFPKGVDQAIVDKMNAAIDNVLANADYAAELADTMQTVPGKYTHDEALDYLATINDQYISLIQEFQASQK
ncbi:MAG: tripartite tricarboxylate transporter substrate binding protein [Oscillospiraceae bacterium]